LLPHDLLCMYSSLLYSRPYKTCMAQQLIATVPGRALEDLPTWYHHQVPDTVHAPGTGIIGPTVPYSTSTLVPFNKDLVLAVIIAF